MFKKIELKLQSERGAMDRVLVTLLLVVVSISALAALYSWSGDKKEDIIDKADSQITKALPAE